MSKEQIFLTESEHAVQKIAHACARANNSSNPVLDVALAIEEIVYEKAQDVAGDLEIWESEHAMMVYKQICSTLIARLPSVRRLCSARPSLLVEKLLKTPADGAMAERQISKPNKPQSTFQRKKGSNKSPTSVADFLDAKPVTLTSSVKKEDEDPMYRKHPMLPPPSRPVQLKRPAEDRCLQQLQTKSIKLIPR